MLKTEVKTIVVCDGCGERIRDGYRSYTSHRDESGRVCAFTLGDEHYCERCKEKAGVSPAEFRTCDCCGKPFSEGFTVEGGFWYCCEECFGDELMNRDYPDGWRENQHEDDPHWCGGYYDFMHEGEWLDTGIFYTEWY